MKKILTLMLLSTALPGLAMAQALNLSTQTDTTLQGDGGEANAEGKTSAAIQAEQNPAVTMEQQIKTGTEPVLNTNAGTALQAQTPALNATAGTSTQTNANANAGTNTGANTNAATQTQTETQPQTTANPNAAAPDMSATTNATANSQTQTEMQAGQATPEAAPVELQQQTTTATDTATTTPAASANTDAAADAAAKNTATMNAPAETATETSSAYNKGVVKTRADLNRANVRQLQQALKAKGAYDGKVDGVWGDQTSAAITNFQSQNSLNVTGVLDQQTIDQLGVEFTASAGARSNARTRQADMDDPANRALESRIVPKSSMTGTAGAEAGASTNMQATPPETAPAMNTSTPAAPMAPAEQPAQENSGYSTTY